MFAMCIDNLFWISSSPEYRTFKKLLWFRKSSVKIMINGKIYNTKIHYIINYRIKSVITCWRDILPAVIVSLILAICG